MYVYVAVCQETRDDKFIVFINVQHLQFCEQATQRCVFEVFYPKFSVRKVCKFSLYIQCLFIDVMNRQNRFNKVANIEGNRVHISAMKTTMSMATYFMATYYKYLATMTVVKCI